ncbi:MAG TPA: DUF1579 family protein [Tepidisphaeraceae bacterium]|nr:DUF1579 family protein [Tepidisphaeraceae bacterium]
MKTGQVVSRLAAVGFVLGMIAAAPPLRAAEDAARPAEFKVLDRWVGDWDLVITVKPNAQAPQGHKATYKSQVRWALNDRFLRCEAQGEGMDGDQKIAEAFMWIITHDPQSKAYSSTVFWSNVPAGATGYWGIVPSGVGTWDEKEQMMSIRSEDKQGMVTLSVTQWIDKDTHRWVQSLTEKNGNVVMEMTGMGRRRK